MLELAKVRKEADELPLENRESLLTYLTHSLTGTPEGSDDEEISRREAGADAGGFQTLGYDDFMRLVKSR